MQCVDIIFADNGDSKIAEVNTDNCFNSTDISFQYVYTTSGTGSGAAMLKPPRQMWIAVVPFLLAAAFM